MKRAFVIVTFHVIASRMSLSGTDGILCVMWALVVTYLGAGVNLSSVTRTLV